MRAPRTRTVPSWRARFVYVIALAVTLASFGSLAPAQAVAFTVDAGGPYTGPANENIQIDATTGGGDGNEDVTWYVEVDGDEQVVSNYASDTIRPSSIGLSLGTHTLTARATNGNGAQATDTAQLTVTSGVPGFKVTLSGPSTVQQYGSITVTATPSPSHNNDYYQWDVDGDGEWDQQSYQNTTTINGDDVGTIDVTVQVLSGVDRTTTATATKKITVTGESEGPTVTVSGPDEVREDQTIQLTAAASPANSAHVFTWDLDGDGAYDDATGKTATVSPKLLGRKYEDILRARVLVTGDPDGDVYSDDKTITVTAAPVVIKFESAPYTVNSSGVAYMRAYTEQNHPNDLFAWEWDNDPNEAEYTERLTRPTDEVATFDNDVYKFAPGTYPVKVRLTSGRDGKQYVTQTSITIPAVVQNAVVDAGGPYSVVKGRKVTITGTSSKEHSKDKYAWDLDGDGKFDDSTAKSVAYDSAKFGKTVGDHTATVRLISGSGGTTTDTATVTIKPLPLVTNTSAPRIDGAVGFGRVLTAQTGTWGPTGVALSYQWLRNGSVIKNATKSQYTPGSADLGSQLTVRITGKKTGYTTVSADSAATSVVKTEPSLAVGIAPGDGSATVLLRVLAQGTTPTGTVQVTSGGVTREATLSTTALTTIPFPGLEAGEQSFTVTYLGSTKVESISTTRKAIIR